MLSQVLIRRLFWRTAIVCGLPAVIFTQPAQTESLAVSVALHPLEARSFELNPRLTQLDAVAEGLNFKVVERRNQLEDIAVLRFEDIPIVGELFDPTGNLNLGMGGALPFSVSVGNVMGAYGVVLKTEL